MKFCYIWQSGVFGQGIDYQKFVNLETVCYHVLNLCVIDQFRQHLFLFFQKFSYLRFEIPTEKLISGQNFMLDFISDDLKFSWDLIFFTF